MAGSSQPTLSTATHTPISTSLSYTTYTPHSTTTQETLSTSTQLPAVMQKGPNKENNVLEAIINICEDKVIATLSAKYDTTLEGNSKINSDFGEVSESSLKILVKELDSLEELIYSFHEFKGVKNFSLLSLNSNEYSLGFQLLRSSSLNQYAEENYYHSSLMFTRLHYNNSKEERFLTLPLSRIQIKDRSTYWVVVVKIPTGDLFAMRSKSITPIEMGSGHKYGDLERARRNGNLRAEKLSVFDDVDGKVFKLGTLVSNDTSTNFEQKRDIESWDTIELSREQVEAYQKK